MEVPESVYLSGVTSQSSRHNGGINTLCAYFAWHTTSGLNAHAAWEKLLWYACTSVHMHTQPYLVRGILVLMQPGSYFGVYLM
jgi:hypothetical protein